MGSISPMTHLKRAVETAVTRAHVWFVARRYKDDALTRLVASEDPELRHYYNLKQREADKFWKKYYDGGPERDPRFRREERLILHKAFEQFISGDELTAELTPLWMHYHAKQITEHPLSAKRPQHRPVGCDFLGPFIPYTPLPEVFQRHDEREWRRRQKSEAGIFEKILNRLQTVQSAKGASKNQDRGLDF